MIKCRFLAAFTVAMFSIISTTYAQSLAGTVVDSDGEILVGANVWWKGTTVGVATDLEGGYKLHRVKDHNVLIAALVGYSNDTLRVEGGVSKVDFKLKTALEIDDIIVTSALNANYIKQDGIAKDEMISFAGLCKMACCNLAESFENSASVTVGFSDAISGARQIQMLGLAGTYTQILDENRPIMRGLSSPYGLSYTPGMWLNSIQVSKGISSVTAGHEAITGQINLEHRKPTDSERFFLNLYINDELRPEANISTALPVAGDGKLSTVVLVHASGDTDVREIDHNSDGYRDLPAAQQYNIANRWSYIADNGLQLRWGVKFLEEDRLGGMWSFDPDSRDTMLEDNIYGSQIQNRGFNSYFKLGTPVGKAVYDDNKGEEFRSNFAFVADFDYFNEDAYFGLNDYDGRENVLSMNGMYNHYFTASSSLILGASMQLQDVSETLDNNTPWLSTRDIYDMSREENEVGLYAEYTYKLDDKFSLIAGLRGDYNSYYDNYHLTPRGQAKWSITPSTTLRGSVGMGRRTSNVITDNIGMLATGRNIVFDNGTDSEFDRQERALTYGGSLTQTFKIIKSGDATISFDYFRTDFENAVVVDQEWDSETIHIYNTDQPYYTNNYQVDLTWSPAAGLDIFTTFRYTDSSITLTRPDGSYYSTEKALVSRYKTLLNLQYATHLRRWVFDATAQLNGPTRLPVQDGVIENSDYSPSYPMFFAQISRRIRAWELYVGCENIANYMQENPIISSNDPYSSAFNSSVIWGPLMGRKFYVGARFNIF
ncbi:MAG: TonB-dependent receptor [Rikenellaceae bacterium]